MSLMKIMRQRDFVFGLFFRLTVAIDCADTPPIATLTTSR